MGFFFFFGHWEWGGVKKGVFSAAKIEVNALGGILKEKWVIEGNTFMSNLIKPSAYQKKARYLALNGKSFPQLVSA